ncbi:putative serine carboxypeptidase CPVL isoform X1 [Dermacentor variabilis]|uniref:putative serine carboxypeptidase CPVL isoform X1 n=2 Tax=Dermacentor variabilis TaxID=34621 RepID=UPI003F5C83FE
MCNLAMTLPRGPLVTLLIFIFLHTGNCVTIPHGGQSVDGNCEGENRDSGDLIFSRFDLRSPEKLLEKKNKSRVCFPSPSSNVEAYSGFINVDERGNSSFLFFLHIKAQEDAGKKPLLLWLQGGPGKSSLFGQFLENGPLGISSSGGLFYRNHTITSDFNVVYLDQPTGTGYSFNDKKEYRRSLNETSIDMMWFLRRFVRIFPEYNRSDFYIAGESYGARFAIGLSSKMLMAEKPRVPLRLRGVMLGAGFLFPLLDLINSTDYLYYSGLLDERGRGIFAARLQEINASVTEKNYTAAAALIMHTVLNIGSRDRPTLFQNLTGFKHHGSIAKAERNEEVAAYYIYANSSIFKNKIHVSTSRVLDSRRSEVVNALAMGDALHDHQYTVEYVLNRTRVLFYTGQFDALFPEMNTERCFRELHWRGSEMFNRAERVFWHRENDTSQELFGYERRAGALTYANVLFGGHYVSLDRSFAVADLYRRFLAYHNKRYPTTTQMPAC